MLKKIKQFFKFKRGDANIWTLLVVPAILGCLIYAVSISGEKNIVTKRTQNAVDSVLLYLSSEGNSSYQTFPGSDEAVKICSFDEQKVEEMWEEAFIAVIKEINGYNETWKITIPEPFVTEDNYNEEQLNITVTGWIPKGRISDYKEYYRKHYPNGVSEDDIKGNFNFFGISLGSWTKIEVSGTVKCR